MDLLSETALLQNEQKVSRELTSFMSITPLFKPAGDYRGSSHRASRKLGAAKVSEHSENKGDNVKVGSLGHDTSMQRGFVTADSCDYPFNTMDEVSIAICGCLHTGSKTRTTRQGLVGIRKLEASKHSCHMLRTSCRKQYTFDQICGQDPAMPFTFASSYPTHHHPETLPPTRRRVGRQKCLGTLCVLV